MTTTTAPVAIVDTLSSLLESQINSVFRFMGEGSPYLSRATADVRRPLAEMVQAEQRRARDLAEAIEALGDVPTPSSIRSDEQYLAYLSLKFLLPRLVQEKRLHIARYQNALGIIPQSNREIRGLIESHLGELRHEMEQLESTSSHVIAAAKAEAK